MRIIISRVDDRPECLPLPRIIAGKIQPKSDYVKGTSDRVYLTAELMQNDSSYPVIVILDTTVQELEELKKERM